MGWKRKRRICRIIVMTLSLGFSLSSLFKDKKWQQCNFYHFCLVMEFFNFANFLCNLIVQCKIFSGSILVQVRIAVRILWQEFNLLVEINWLFRANNGFAINYMNLFGVKLTDLLSFVHWATFMYQGFWLLFSSTS